MTHVMMKIQKQVNFNTDVEILLTKITVIDVSYELLQLH